MGCIFYYYYKEHFLRDLVDSLLRTYNPVLPGAVVGIDEWAVALGVGVVPGGLAVGTDEGPEDGAGDQTVGSPQLVAPVLLLRLPVAHTELAPVSRHLSQLAQSWEDLLAWRTFRTSVLLQQYPEYI